jgi:hypothetical protein
MEKSKLLQEENKDESQPSFLERSWNSITKIHDSKDVKEWVIYNQAVAWLTLVAIIFVVGWSCILIGVPGFWHTFTSEVVGKTLISLLLAGINGMLSKFLATTFVFIVLEIKYRKGHEVNWISYAQNQANLITKNISAYWFARYYVGLAILSYLLGLQLWMVAIYPFDRSEDVQAKVALGLFFYPAVLYVIFFVVYWLIIKPKDIQKVKTHSQNIRTKVNTGDEEIGSNV